MSHRPSSQGPLAGVRVLDLSHHLGAPLATMALAQMGADVIKVEPPAGDEWRRVDDVRGESRQFHAANRDKRGIVLDLRTEDGREALGLLIELAAYRFEPPWGFTHGQVLMEAHKVRVERGDYAIAEIHLADAIERLTAKGRDSLSADRGAKDPYRKQ